MALGLFLFGGSDFWVNMLSMVLFGIAIGVLICFIGGLMAVSIVPRKATGAALGIMGRVSYIAAGMQDVISRMAYRQPYVARCCGSRTLRFRAGCLVLVRSFGYFFCCLS